MGKKKRGGVSFRKKTLKRSRQEEPARNGGFAVVLRAVVAEVLEQGDPQVLDAATAALGKKRQLSRRGTRAGHTGRQYTPVVTTATKNCPSKRASRAVSA